MLFKIYHSTYVKQISVYVEFDYFNTIMVKITLKSLVHTFFSLHHIVPIQFYKCINPEAAPVPALKVEIREGPIERRLAL